jgi:CheY-like chemotaxis protein
MVAKKLILLVDDDQSVLDYLTTKLSKLYTVVATSNPREAADLAARRRPDIILCDIDMPGMGGGEVAAQLEKDPMTAAIPLVYLTGLVSPEEARDLNGFVSGRPGVAKRGPLAELVATIDAFTA